MQDARSRREILLGIEQSLEHLHLKLSAILRKENIIMAQIDDVISAVADESAVDDSAIVLLTNLTDMIKAAGTDPVKLDAVVASINANKQKLADAVVQNTPATTGGSTGGI